MSPHTVLFDLDGTLVETHIDFSEMKTTVVALSRDAGVPDNIWEGRDILGIIDAASDEIANRGESNVTFRERSFSALEEMEEAGSVGARPMAGALVLLDNLRARGVKVGVVTRNCRRVSRRIMKHFALPYDILLSRDDVKKTKPHPEHLWTILHQLDCEPRHSIMVGDHWMDIQAGRRAGVNKTIGVLGKHEVDWFSPCPPDAIAPTLADVDRLLKLSAPEMDAA